LAGKEPDGRIHGLLLLAEIEDVAIGFGVVEHAVGARKRLNQPVVLEVFVHVEGVEVFGVETGEQHVHHDDDIDLLRVGHVLVGVLLILDALLHILIVEIELANAVVGVEARVVVGDDGLECLLLFVRFLFVVDLLLRKVFLYLLHILVVFGGRRENAGDVQRLDVAVFSLFFWLRGLEQCVIFNRVIDRGRGQQGIELAPVGGGIVLGQNRLNNGFLGQRLARLGFVFAFGLVIVNMEAQDVAVFDSVGDGVDVQLLLEDVLGGLE